MEKQRAGTKAEDVGVDRTKEEVSLPFSYLPCAAGGFREADTGTGIRPAPVGDWLFLY